jgi:hypothetical protein
MSFLCDFQGFSQCGGFPLIDHRARKQSMSTLGASFLTATPTSGNFVQPQVWRVMVSRHLRLSIYDDAILPLYCRMITS